MIEILLKFLLTSGASVAQNQNGVEVLYDRASEVNTGLIPRSLLRNRTNASEFN